MLEINAAAQVTERVEKNMNVDFHVTTPPPSISQSPPPPSHCTVSFALHYVQDKAALFRAAESGDVAAVRRLLDAYVDINSTDEVCIITKYVSHVCRVHMYGVLSVSKFTETLFKQKSLCGMHKT